MMAQVIMGFKFAGYFTFHPVITGQGKQSELKLDKLMIKLYRGFKKKSSDY